MSTNTMEAPGLVLARGTKNHPSSETDLQLRCFYLICFCMLPPCGSDYPEKVF